MRSSSFRRSMIGVFAGTCILVPAAHAQEVETRANEAEILVIAPEARSIHAETQQAAVGPLGTVRIQDVPNTINVVPRALIEQQQLKNLQDAFRYIPSVQGDGARPYSRGFQGSVVQNSRIDGLNIVSTTDYAAEQFERIEVLNGLSGAIYGPANPAGVFNFVLKRPTAEPLTYGRVGYSNDDLWLQSVDLSHSFANGLIGVRVNALNEKGATFVEGSHISRQLASAALDIRFAPTTVLETNFSYYRFVSLGLPPTFALGNGIAFPKDIEPENRLYGQPYGGARNHTWTASGRLRHDFNDDWHALVGLSHQIADRNSTAITNTINTTAGDYTSTTSSTAASRFTILSNLAYLNGEFSTGMLNHKLAIGTNGFLWKNYNPRAGQTIRLGSASLSNPRAFAEPAFPDFKNRYRSARAKQQTVVLTDTVEAGQFSLALTGSYSWLETVNTNLAGPTSHSSDEGFSPAVSIVYKPTSAITAYATYASSIQQGDTAPTGTTNVNEILAPFRSKQWEAGVKLGLAKLDVTLAAFQITRPFAFIRPITPRTGIFVVDGEQRNRGVELMVNGEVLPRLTVYGGVAYLDPKVLNTATSETNDKRIVGLADVTASLLATWQVPGIEHLWLDGFVRYVSSRPTDNLNRFYTPSYATLNLGAKNVVAVAGKDVTFRLDVINVTDKRYLTNLSPAGLNGFTGAGNASANLGRPRSIQLSVGIAL